MLNRIAGIPHAAFEDDIYAGYFIPKGSVIIPNIWYDPIIVHCETDVEPLNFSQEIPSQSRTVYRSRNLQARPISRQERKGRGDGPAGVRLWFWKKVRYFLCFLSEAHRPSQNMSR